MPMIPSLRTIKRCGLITGVIFFLALADTLISSYRDDGRTILALPGSSHAISGDVSSYATRLEDLTYITDARALHLRFVEAKGRLWRGRVEVNPAAAVGRHTFRVFDRRNPATEPPPVFQVMVFEDEQALRKSQLSVSRRLLGIAPWWFIAACLPLLAAALLLSYYHTSRREALLETQGIMPIIKLSRQKTHWEIGFAAGLGRTPRAGDKLALLNHELEQAGQLRVHQVQDGLVTAQAGLEETVAPDFYVRVGKSNPPVEKIRGAKS